MAVPCLLIGFTLSGPAQEIQETEIPIPKPIETIAIKGQPVKIELSATARTRASTVEFLIRDQPKNGKPGILVSDPKDRTRATMTYTAFRGTAATTDSFTFAVRYPAGRWSREVKVDIELKEAEPLITVNPRSDFGKALLGNFETREILIRNSGKAGYQRQIKLPAPWSFVEPVNGFINIPMGAASVAKIRFSPVEPGKSEYQLFLNNNAGAVCSLSGTGIAPFTVTKPTLTLNWEKTAGIRSGEIELVSGAPDMIPITVRAADERLVVDGGLSRAIKPGGEPVQIKVFLPSGDVNAYGGQIEIAAGAYRVPVRIEALPPPAWISVETGRPEAPDTIEFGTLEAGKTGDGSFLVRNIGGAPARVRFELSEPFQILAAGSAAIISPGEAEAYAVRFTAPEGEKWNFDEVLKISVETGQLAQVRLKAAVETKDVQFPELPSAFNSNPAPQMAPQPGVTAPGRMPATDDALIPDPLAHLPPGMTTEEIRRLRSPLGFVTLPLIERKISHGLPVVGRNGVTIEEKGLNHVTVSWELPRPDLREFEIEMRGIRENPVSGGFENVWAPFHDVDYEIRDDRVFATIRSLRPNEISECRVFALGPEGKVSNPAAFPIGTAIPMDWTWIYIGFGIFLLALGGAIFWRWKTARQY